MHPSAAERVHLDHNATTPLRPEVRAAWLAALDEVPGNPSAVHASGRRARQMIDDARERIAGALAVHEDEILFTSGGTESNNLALIGALRARGPSAGLAITAVEHSSVIEVAEALGQAGHPCRVVGVDRAGVPDPHALAEAARDPRIALLSTQAANNEVGSLTALDQLAELLPQRDDRRRPLWHVDAVQALGRIPLELREWGVDLASVSAHKLGGPLGVGLLFRRTGVRLEPLAHGGGQESGLRPGTENAAALAAAALAVELAVRDRARYAARVGQLVEDLWNDLCRRIPSVALVGPELSGPRLPNTLTVRLPHADGRVLVTQLDVLGLEASAGSACASGSLEPSHILLAMGYDDEEARAGLRLSLGRDTTRDDCRKAVEILQQAAVARRVR